jgi:hypothetical protein
MASLGVQKKREKGRGEHLVPPQHLNERNAMLAVTIITGLFSHHTRDPTLYNADTMAKDLYLIRHVTTETGRRICCRRCRFRVVCCSTISSLIFRTLALDTGACYRGRCIVVVVAGGLHDVHRDGIANVELEELACDNGPNDQAKEDDEHEKVEDRIADDSALSELALLHRVDRRADLTTGTLLAGK